MLANIIIGTSSILYDRMHFNINEEHVPIFNSLKGATPGEFRHLMKVTRRHEPIKDQGLTEELKAPIHLFYLIEADADKNRQQFTIPLGSFVGEISFILKGNATATVTMKAGCRYLSWDKNQLIESTI